MYFYNTLSHKKKIHFVEKVGISGTAINTSRDIEVCVEELFIYNCNGDEMIHYSSTNKDNNDISEVYKRIIFKKGEQLNSQFIELFMGQYKILIFFKCELNVVCIFKEGIHSSVVKFYIKFILNAFCNFIGQNVFIKNFNCDWKYICKIFEVFFVPYLNKKFFSLIYQISNVEEFFGKEQEKLQNLLIIDTKTKAILYNFRKTVKKKKIVNYSLKDEIWNSLQLHMSITKVNTKTKMDLMSTYPRLRFTTQIFSITPNTIVNEANFALITIYSINKLSRNSHKYYEHEVSTINSNESRQNCIIDNFVTFLYEYFSSVNTSSNLCYFDSDMLVIIDEGLYNKMSFENFIIFLKKKIQNMLIAKAKDDNNYHNNFNIENIVTVNKDMIYTALYSYKKKSFDFLSGVSLDKSMHSEELSRQISLIPKNFDTTGFVSPSDLVGVNEISDDIDEDTKYYSSNKNRKANKDASPKSNYSTGVRKDKVAIVKDIQFKLMNYDNNGIAFHEYKIRGFSSNNNSPNGRIKKIQSAQMALFRSKINSNQKNENEEEHFEGYHIKVNSESDDSHDNDDGSHGVFIKGEGNKLTNNLLEFYRDKKSSSNQASPRSPHFYHHDSHDTL